MSDLPVWLLGRQRSADTEQPSFQTTLPGPSPFDVSPSTATDRQVVSNSSGSSHSSRSCVSHSSALLVEDDGKTPRRPWLQQLGAGILYVISCMFLALLVYAIVAQLNDDSNALIWILYYSAHTAMVTLFVLTRVFRLDSGMLGGLLLLLSTLMLGFTGVMLWFSVGDYRDASSQEPGQDMKNQNKKEETLFEVCGAAFGGLSVVYHVLVWKCTTTKSGQKKQKTYNRDEENRDI